LGPNLHTRHTCPAGIPAGHFYGWTYASFFEKVSASAAACERGPNLVTVAEASACQDAGMSWMGLVAIFFARYAYRGTGINNLGLTTQRGGSEWDRSMG
jgi:hypothetical protein